MVMSVSLESMKVINWGIETLNTIVRAWMGVFFMEKLWKTPF
jgi:hypothetical protein